MPVFDLPLCPLRHKIGSDIDECFGDLSSILAGRFPFCLAELADGRDDMASCGMTSKDGPPKLGRVRCSSKMQSSQSNGSKVCSSILVNPGRWSFGVSARLTDIPLYSATMV